MKNKYRPEIKICGITNLPDARAACDAGADYLGFVLYDKSPRSISAGNLRRLLEKIDRKIRTVGVFVNEPVDKVTRVASDCGLDIIQLCAEEPYAEFSSFPLPVWRVIRIMNNIPEPDPAKWLAERHVLDAVHADLYGGTGAVMDWSVAARIAKKHKIMLAGGLTPENAAEAVRIVRPFGVDVSSGVESRPGRKDHEKMRFFIEAIRNP